MLPLALSISACGPTHFAALSKTTHDSLADCKRPIEPPEAWLSTCGDGEEGERCRRVLELPVHRENAQRHHRCATIVEQVKREADRVRDGN